jgi:hypothetical protein
MRPTTNDLLSVRRNTYRMTFDVRKFDNYFHALSLLVTH